MLLHLLFKFIFTAFSGRKNQVVIVLCTITQTPGRLGSKACLISPAARWSAPAQDGLDNDVPVPERPSMTSSSMLTLSSPIPAIGWQSVVSVGRMYSEKVSPSIAMTEQSRGTSLPQSASAFIAAMAIASDMLKMAVNSAPESISRLVAS